MAKSNIKIDITADDNASKKLKNLDDQVSKTGDGIGKFGKAAAIGGAAIVALGVKSVLAFEDLGLTVGKFADATGATTEEASRLIEVAGDIGISAETLQSSIGKMSKQLGANEAAFKSYGIEVAKNADGTTNLNETFLGAVDAINAIPDPLKKAEAAAKVFGKGYQGMAELLGQSSDEIRTKLAEVSDAKVFDDKKVKDARDMRAAFDSIVDAGQDLILTIGKSLAPVITKLAPVLVKVVEAAAPAAEALGEVLVSALEVLGPILEALLPVIKKVADALTLLSKAVALFEPTGLTKGIKEAGESLDLLRDKATEAGLSAEQFKQIVEDSAGSMAKTGDATKDLATLIDTASGRLDEMTTSTSETDRETRRLGDSVEDLGDDVDETVKSVDIFTQRVQAADAAYSHLIGKLDEEEAWANVQTAIMEFAATIDPTAEDVRNLTRDLADYVHNTTLIPETKKTKYLAELDAGQLALVEQQLAALARNRTVSLDIVTKGGPGYNPGTGPAFAEGGVVPGPKGAPVVATVHGGETVRTSEQEKALNGNGGGGSTTVNIYPQFMPTPKQLANILAQYDRHNATNIVTPVGR